MLRIWRGGEGSRAPGSAESALGPQLGKGAASSTARLRGAPLGAEWGVWVSQLCFLQLRLPPNDTDWLQEKEGKPSILVSWGYAFFPEMLGCFPKNRHVFSFLGRERQSAFRQVMLGPGTVSITL